MIVSDFAGTLVDIATDSPIAVLDATPDEP